MFTVNLASGIGVALVGLPTVVLHLAPLIALYSLVSVTPAPRSLIGLGASLAALIGTTWLHGFDEDISTVIGNVVGIAAVWTAGYLVYGRRVYVQQLETRTRELEEARGELAHKIATEERVRIARELHDIVAHSLSVIAVQSGAGAHVIDDQPEEAKRSLQAIETASRRALQEMRAMLSVLRNGSSTEKAPLPGLADLDGLIDQVSASGVEVDLQLQGEAPKLPPAIDLTAYRIVQESLTNVVKHAQAEHARVVVTFGAKRLSIDVADDGRAAEPARPEGQGMKGMRERVEMFDGLLETKALSGGGFHVHAELPIEAER